MTFNHVTELEAKLLRGGESYRRVQNPQVVNVGAMRPACRRCEFEMSEGQSAIRFDLTLGTTSKRAYLCVDCQGREL